MENVKGEKCKVRNYILFIYLLCCIIGFTREVFATDIESMKAKQDIISIISTDIKDLECIFPSDVNLQGESDDSVRRHVAEELPRSHNSTNYLEHVGNNEKQSNMLLEKRSFILNALQRCQLIDDVLFKWLNHSELQSPIGSHSDSNAQQVRNNINTIIEKNMATIRLLHESLDGVERNINVALYSKNERDTFKTLISVLFGGLIAIVIALFFIMASRGNESSLAAEIFSSPSGLQFITLFTLVICIAMFGILGILEGKELSALLGAISGYVLGRVSAHDVHAAVAHASRQHFASKSKSHPTAISDSQSPTTAEN